MHSVLQQNLRLMVESIEKDDQYKAILEKMYSGDLEPGQHIGYSPQGFVRAKLNDRSELRFWGGSMIPVPEKTHVPIIPSSEHQIMKMVRGKVRVTNFSRVSPAVTNLKYAEWSKGEEGRLVAGDILGFGKRERRVLKPSEDFEGSMVLKASGLYMMEPAGLAISHHYRVNERKADYKLFLKVGVEAEDYLRDKEMSLEDMWKAVVASVDGKE
jgi:hypothetical protein